MSKLAVVALLGMLAVAAAVDAETQKKVTNDWWLVSAA